MIALKGASFDGDLVVESFVNMPPHLASALSVWRPVARDRDEVLDIGLPYLKSLARATRASRSDRREAVSFTEKSWRVCGDVG